MLCSCSENPGSQALIKHFSGPRCLSCEGPSPASQVAHVVRLDGIAVLCSPTEVVLPGDFQGLSKMGVMRLLRKPGEDIGDPGGWKESDTPVNGDE